MRASALRSEFRDWSLCVFALDRLSRNMVQIIQTVLDLDSAGRVPGGRRQVPVP